MKTKKKIKRYSQNENIFSKRGHRS